MNKRSLEKPSGLTPEEIARDEYEVHLYGFTINSLMKENFEFVENMIQTATDKYTHKMASLVENPKPATQAKLEGITTAVCREVTSSCAPQVKKINEFIRREFSIPDNVLLSEDENKLEISAHSVQELEEECEKLKDQIKENKYFNLALLEELKGYSEMEEVFEGGNFALKNVEEFLVNNLDLEVLDTTARKIHDILFDE